MNSAVAKTWPFPNQTASTHSISVGYPLSGGGTTSGVQAADVENAVYAYIQAMRALNRTHITPEDAASALGISVAEAMAALTSLQSRGVRRSR
jgi:hypothetical protein